jgi:O-antigen/teichoic acid export membrane protein
MISLGGSYLGAALTIVKGIFLVPLFLRIFGIELYGAFLASANVVGLLGIVDLGVSSVLAQRLAETWGARDRAQFSRSTGSGLALGFALAAVMLVAGAILSPYAPRLVKAPEHARAILSLTFILTAAGSAITLAMTNLLSIASAWQRTEIVAASRLGGQLVDLVVVVVGLYAGLGVVALGLGSIIGAALGFVVAASWTAASWRTLGLERPRASYLGVVELARTTVPMMLSRVALQIGSNSEIALISALVNPATAAVYALTDRALRVVITFVNPIAGSVLSGLAHFVGQHGLGAAAAPARELLAVWSLIVAAVLPPFLALNQDFTTLWVGRTNFGGFALNTALCAAAIVTAREVVLTVVLTASGAIRTVAWLSIIEVAIRLPLMYLALRLLGSVGVPTSSVLVSAAFLIVYAQFTNRRLQLPGEKGRRFQFLGSLSIVASLALGMVEALALPHATTWAGLLAKGALIGTAHVSMASLLNPAGRAAFLRRLARRRVH